MKDREPGLEEVAEARNAANEKHSDIESLLKEKENDKLEVNMTPALKEEKRDNIILLGPEGCGKK